MKIYFLGKKEKYRRYGSDLVKGGMMEYEKTVIRQLTQVITSFCLI